MLIAVNQFVKRQVKGSGKTYSEKFTFNEIASHAENQMELGFFEDGYRDGVRIVSCDKSIVKHFQCPYTKINSDTALKAQWVSRQEGEEPYIQIRALNGESLPAGKVEFILYRHDVLAENNEQSTDAEWELISIQAIPTGIEHFPMGPVTMMRNQLDLMGGTKAHYSSEQWAESVRFWQQYVALDY
ncbi:MAG: DUF3228 family protein [Candidatus Marinimicrobia bacterium]|nr:DUF3228 family protein [Candidatus Neomarinimicrobiota bacterium]